MRRWIRLDVGWSDSEWVGALEPAARLAWVELLTYVKRDGVRGVAKALTATAFGRKVRIPENDVVAMLVAAQNDGALAVSGGDWVIANWGSYQVPDNTATARQRRHRGDKSRLSPLRRDTRDRALQPVTDRDMGCDPSRDVDMDIDSKERPPSGGPKKKAFALPETWQPTDAHRKLAAKLGVADMELEVDKFRDHAAANDRKQASWDASFRNWLRTAKQYSNGKALPAPPLLEDVLALIRCSPSLVWHYDGRPSAFEIMQQKRPEVWARAGPTIRRIQFADLQAVKDNDWELRHGIQHQLNHLAATAGHGDDHTADTAGTVAASSRGTG